MKVKLTGGEPYFYFGDTLGSPWVVWQSSKKSATFSVKTYVPFGTPIIATGAGMEKRPLATNDWAPIVPQ